jgi:hypothetical protein
MLTLLLSCTTLGPTTATADATQDATLRELDVRSEGTAFYADAENPGAVIVACEYERGIYRYGPNADPRIEVSWNPAEGGYYSIGVSDEPVGCRVWAIR